MDSIYVYCLTKKIKINGFAAKGINDHSIIDVDYKDIMALGHPYKSSTLSTEDTNRIVELAMRHHQVVENAWQTFGTLIPLKFGSIIQGENETQAFQNVKEWIERIYNHIQKRFEDLKDRAEYGIQVFWPNDGLMKKVARNHAQVKCMERKIATAPKEAVCIYKNRQKSLLQRYIEKEIILASRSLLDRVRPFLNDFQIEQITVEKSDSRMLLNISCLLSDKEIYEIKSALEKIRNEEGYIPCLSGPWPPYSFAKLNDKLCPSNRASYYVKPGGRVRCV